MTALRLGTPLLVGGHELLPVERRVAQAHGMARQPSFLAVAGPVALVVREPDGTTRAMDMAGQPAPLDDLKRDVPGLAAWLDGTTGPEGPRRRA